MLSCFNIYTVVIDVLTFRVFVSMIDTAHATEECTFFTALVF